MTEKRERCGGRAGNPGLCDPGCTCHLPEQPCCNLCPGCHSCAPDKWCEHDLEVCGKTQNHGHNIGKAAWIEYFAPTTQPKFERHHADGTACVSTKTEKEKLQDNIKEAQKKVAQMPEYKRNAPLFAVSSGQIKPPTKCPTCGSEDGVPRWKGGSGFTSQNNLHFGWHSKVHSCEWTLKDVPDTDCYPCPVCSAKQAPTCPVHGEGLCIQEKFRQANMDWWRCPHQYAAVPTNPHFLCGCPQEYGRVHTDTCGAWRWLSDCDDPYCPHYGIHQHAQESGSGDAQGPGCESAPSSDPSPFALAMEAAKEWAERYVEHESLQEGLLALASIISRAISAAVKERDERIAELEGALKEAAGELAGVLDAIKTQGGQLDASNQDLNRAQRIYNRAAQALKGKP